MAKLVIIFLASALCTSVLVYPIAVIYFRRRR